ncbi:MAG: DUF2867 domain-containing protein [Anaerolineales bacterium]|nr:MAG: DUF2867 domain-containing protein [Anaerolineales bacterium]
MVSENNKDRLILVTGATGYIGGRLVPRLLKPGYRVRCLVRDPAPLHRYAWHSAVETVTGDVLQPDTLGPAMQGVSAAYYLIHSMSAGSGFHQLDLVAAHNFGTAACEAGVEQLIYLGGLAETTSNLSQHLRSRLQTGDALRSSGIPVTEFRAGVIVGSGSISFEMIRYLTERVPVMICPRWVYTPTQPIGIGEVLEYLATALDVPESSGRIIEVGGSEIITYGKMMIVYAEVRGLKRWMVPVPVLTPRLSSYWVNLVTPISSALARPLIEGLRTESTVHDPIARQLFPHVQPVDYRTSVERALTDLEPGKIDSTWIDYLSATWGDGTAVTMTVHEGMILEFHKRVVPSSAETVYHTFTGLGGKRRWPAITWVWKLRGFLDQIFGGVGFRRERRDPDELQVGDALDFWRVETLEPGHLLRLRSEMKMPGIAWLEWHVTPRGKESALLLQTSFFAPKGMLGWLYWYAVYPLHKLIYKKLIDQIAAHATSSKLKEDSIPKELI